MERLVAAAAMQTREILNFLPRAGKPMAATIQAWQLQFKFAIQVREIMQMLS